MEKDVVNIKADLRDIKIEPFNWPVSFICGKDAILRHFNTIEPESGIVTYVFHESEFGDGEWIPDLSELKSSRIASYCTPDSYFDFMKRTIEKLEHSKPGTRTWDFVELEGISLGKT